MWSDNETTVDLLGFKVHADLIRDIVTDTAALPIVLGVFGDWGGGKSSIMKMLEQDLQSDGFKDVVCLYFNGWTFEGYEDAKTALLTSVLLQLGEHKRFGPKLKSNVVRLLKRVKLMEASKLTVRYLGFPLAIAALTSGIGAVPAAAAGLFAMAAASSEPDKKDASSSGTKGGKDKATEANWLDLIKDTPDKVDLLEVRKFREEFAKMLGATDIQSLVILIDDLDRCLPDRIIETLEAIKLFVAVPKTGFVIGADPRIIRHAIATRYVAPRVEGVTVNPDADYDLVKDYLEKLIQVPYHLPRLSPAEIETYINLLACQKHLVAADCAAVLEDWTTKRKDFYAAYQQGAIREVLGASMTEALAQQLSWSNSISLVLTEGLKGNPRQVKRMLNAMVLRERLAKIASIDIRNEVLAKLMVLEYSHLERLQDLNTWQAASNGFPEQLRTLEAWALEGDAPTSSPGKDLEEWSKRPLWNWLRMQPSLQGIDLRDYFWLARDRTQSTLSGVTMVSPLVRRLFDELVSGNDGEKHIAARTVASLEADNRESLLHLFEQQVQRHPDQLAGPAALTLLAEEGVAGAARTLFASLRRAEGALLDAGVAFRLQALGKGHPALADEARGVLELLRSNATTRIGKAAEKALTDWA